MLNEMSAALRQKLFYTLLVFQFVFVLVIAVPLLALSYIEGVDEFRLKVEPVDPYDQFYGYYVTLNYDISRVPLRLYNQDPDLLQEGDALYVLLQKNKQGYFAAKSIWTSKPIVADGEKLLKGRVQYVYQNELPPAKEEPSQVPESQPIDPLVEESYVNVIYGFERFYGSEQLSKKLEEQFNQWRDKGATKPAYAVIRQSPWAGWIPWAQYHVDDVVIEK